jgi:nucleotide-binding universal stress UspA family protein
MTTLFERIVCGVDRSEAGEAAARIAARVADPSGTLTLVSVDDPSIAAHAGWQAPALAAELAHDAEVALERGRAEALPSHAVETRLLEGNPLHCLLAEIDRKVATLAVVGTHGVPRATGIALGSVATHLLHDAPCSVLVARPTRDGGVWPRSLVVGIDGFPESAAALVAARELAGRFGAPCRVVLAVGNGPFDLDAARLIAPDLELRDGKVVDELHELSEHADLVVVGSRGLRGLRALGSVSERVAHEAQCSVLVVRTQDRS